MAPAASHLGVLFYTAEFLHSGSEAVLSLTLDPRGVGAHIGALGTDSTVRPQDLNCGVVRPSVRYGGVCL